MKSGNKYLEELTKEIENNKTLSKEFKDNLIKLILKSLEEAHDIWRRGT